MRDRLSALTNEGPESVLSSDVQGRQYPQEAMDNEPKGKLLEVELHCPLHGTYSCPVKTLPHELCCIEAKVVHWIYSNRTVKEPVTQEKQTSSHKTVTPQGIEYVMVGDRKFVPEEHQRQKESETSGGSSGKGTWALWRAEVRDRDNHIVAHHEFRAPESLLD